MSAHVLLNLLNELGKRDKMRGLPSILSLFRNEFNKFNYTRARMLDSIYHMTLRRGWTGGGGGTGIEGAESGVEGAESG